MTTLDDLNRTLLSIRCDRLAQELSNHLRVMDPIATGDFDRATDLLVTRMESALLEPETDLATSISLSWGPLIRVQVRLAAAREVLRLATP